MPSFAQVRVAQSPASRLPETGARRLLPMTIQMQRPEAGPIGTGNLVARALQPQEPSGPRPAQPLPEATHGRMARAFGRRFDDVAVHPDSPRASGRIQALTEGQSIHFAPGRFRPGTPKGDWLIGHELAHVVQQTRGGRPVSQPFAPRLTRRDPLEVEADQAADNAMAGRPASIVMGAPLGQVQAFEDGGEPAAAAPAPGVTNAGGPASGDKPGQAKGGSGTADLLMPEAPAELTGPARARLAGVSARAGAAAKATTALPGAKETTAKARGAVKEPTEEQDARAEAELVEEVDDRPAPSAAIEKACLRIREIIRSKRPPDKDSLVDAKPKEMAKQAGGAVNDNVESRAEDVQGEYDVLDEKPKGEPGREPVPVKQPPEAVTLPDMNADEAAPDPLTEKDVSLDADVEAQKQSMDEAGMNTESAKLVETGPIAEARGALGELEDKAGSGPAEVLAQQETAINDAKSAMRALQEQAAGELASSRAATVGTVKGMSVDTTASEEKQRAQVGAKMQGIFTDAQTRVNNLLAPLSDSAVARWDAGVKRLSSEFEASLAHVKQRIDERHSNTLVKWWDDWTGLPDWVVEAYDKAENLFSEGCCDLAGDISRDVNQVIGSCEQIIQEARTQIDNLIQSLPGNLKAWASGEAARVGAQLDSLHGQVQDTRTKLDEGLVERANAAVQEVRERVHALREEAKGVLGRLADALSEFLADPLRAILDGLLTAVGIEPPRFHAMIDKLGDVIAGIVADPVKFAGNLMDGVGQGFSKFFDNFPTHLMQGMMDWLFSKLGEAGVTLPKDFSLESIVTLVLQVLGITWDRIRRLLAKHIGEDNVALIDKAVELVSTLIEKGPGGIVELIKDQLDPQVIVDAMLEAAKDYLVTALIKQVSVRLLLLFNPVGAIFEAIRAIYKVLSWIFQNASRIFTLIETVVNGAADVLAGNVGGLAASVEMALAGLIGPVIGFLADFIGLGGIPEAIRNVILGLQQWVEGILDKVIGFLADKARALLKAVGLGGKDGEAGDAMSIAPVPFQANTGKDGQKEDHTLSVRIQGGQPRIILASNDPKEVKDKLSDKEYQDLVDAKARAEIMALVREAYELIHDVRKARKDAKTKPEKKSTAEWRAKEKEARGKLAEVATKLKALSNERGYPAPVVGRHKVLEKLADTETPPPKEGKRVSHHVPAAELANNAASFLEQEKEKIKDRFGSKSDRLVEQIDKDIGEIKTLYDGRGQYLSAILIHRETHNSSGRGIHNFTGKDRDKLEANIQTHEKSLKRKVIRVVLQDGITLASNPKGEHWTPFIEACKDEVIKLQPSGKSPLPTVHSIDSLEESEREILFAKIKVVIKAVMRQALQDAYIQGKAAVEERLKTSAVDGRNPEKVVRGLYAEIKKAWAPMLEMLS